MSVCPTCCAEIRRQQQKLSCSYCLQIHHRTCTGMSQDKYRTLCRDGSAAWMCLPCSFKEASLNMNQDQYRTLCREKSAVSLSSLTPCPMVVSPPLAVQSLVSTSSSTIQSAVSTSSATTQSAVSTSSATTQSAMSTSSATIRGAVSTLSATIRSAVSTLSAPTQSAVSTSSATTQSAVSTSSATIWNAVSTLSATIRSAVSTLSETTQSAGATSSATTQSAGATSSATTQSAVSTSSSTTQGAVSTSSATTQSAGATSSATTQSAVSTSSSTTQSAVSTSYSTTQSAMSSSSATTHSLFSTSSSTTQGAVFTSSATTQSAMSTSSATTHSLVSTSSSTTQGAVSTSSATTQSAVSTSSATTHRLVSTSSSTTQCLVSSTSSTTQSAVSTSYCPLRVPTKPTLTSVLGSALPSEVQSSEIAPISAVSTTQVLQKNDEQTGPAYHCCSLHGEVKTGSNVSTGVRMVSLPFYTKIADMAQPQVLGGYTQVSIDRICTLSFILTTKQVDIIRRNSKDIYGQVLLRFCLHNKTKIQPDNIPDLYIKVNNRFVDVKSSVNLVSKSKVIHEPVDITSLLYHNDYRTNNISINYKTKDNYYVTCELVKKRTVVELLKVLREQKVIHPEHTKDLVLSKLKPDDDIDITTTSLKASLTCPIGKMRLINPCRGKNCSHIQCLDALTVLSMNKNKSMWKCPICEQPASFDDISIDKLFLDILDSVPWDIVEVEFHEDGSWTHKKSAKILDEEIDKENSCIVLDETIDKLDIIDLTDTEDDYHTVVPLMTNNTLLRKMATMMNSVIDSDKGVSARDRMNYHGRSGSQSSTRTCSSSSNDSITSNHRGSTSSSESLTSYRMGSYSNLSVTNSNYSTSNSNFGVPSSNYAGSTSNNRREIGDRVPYTSGIRNKSPSRSHSQQGGCHRNNRHRYRENGPYSHARSNVSSKKSGHNTYRQASTNTVDTGYRNGNSNLYGDSYYTTIMHRRW